MLIHNTSRRDTVHWSLSRNQRMLNQETLSETEVIQLLYCVLFARLNTSLLLSIHVLLSLFRR